ADEQRTVAGREQPVGTALRIEREHLLPLAAEGFDLAEISFPQVNSLGCVKVKTNAYSVPVKAGTPVQVHLRATQVEIWHAAPRGPLPEQVVQQQCKPLGLPTVGGQCARLAAAAEREHQPYLDYLAALLAAELEDREQRAIARRLKDAHLPRVKTLEEFDFAQAPRISAAQLQGLAEGGYLDRAEPVVFLG